MMTPHAIATKLRASLPTTYAVVSTPDHPDLLMAPALLVGGEGRLTAVFLLTPNLDFEDLEARLIAARLALPVATRLVAVCSEDDSFSADTWHHFDSVMEALEGVMMLAKIIQSNLKPKVNAVHLRQAKQFHAIRRSACGLITQLRHQRALRQKAMDRLTAPMHSKLRHTISSSAALRSSDLTASEPSGYLNHVHALKQGRDEANDLRLGWQHGLRHGFKLLEGTPDANLCAEPLLLLRSQWPDRADEWEKQVKSMAFSGWVMASPESDEDVQRLFDRIQIYLQKKHHVRR